MKISKVFLGIIALALVVGISSIMVNTAVAKTTTVANKAITEVDLDFLGYGQKATIYPFAHSSDEYLIVMHNLKYLTAVGAYTDYKKELTVQQLPAKLWTGELRPKLFFFGYFNKNNQKKAYAFELLRLSYHAGTHDFTVHAKSVSVRGWSAFSTKKETTLSDFKVYIDPVPEMVGYSYHPL